MSYQRNPDDPFWSACPVCGDPVTRQWLAAAEGCNRHRRVCYCGETVNPRDEGKGYKCQAALHITREEFYRRLFGHAPTPREVPA